MSALDWVSLAILVAGIGAHVYVRSYFVRFGEHIFWLSVAALASVASYRTALQYFSFLGDPMGKFFLPPHESIGYFIHYAGTRFFNSFLLSLLIAIIVPAIARRLNTRYGERFFEKDEFLLMRLGLLLTGYPGALFYLVAILVTGVGLSGFYSYKGKGRAPFYYLWLPAAVFVIIMKNIIFSQGFLALFLF